VGLDSLLARHCGRDPDRDFLAREVSESTAVVFDSSIWMALLGGLRRAGLASSIVTCLDLHSLDDEESLIEEPFPENIAC
jgi:hypothetical protein